MSAFKHTNPRAREQTSETQRLEAFSDGVFAIAITLLILDIHTPVVSTHETVPHLGRDLVSLWPKIGIYVLSFVNIGIYWANHHYLFKLFKRTNHIFNLLNVLFLMCISFVPLPTSVLGEYLTSDLERKASVAFYCIGMFLPGFCWCMIWLYAKTNGLIDENLSPGFVRFLTVQYVFSNCPYLIAAGFAFINPWISLGLGIGFTFLYLLPPKKPEFIHSHTGLSDEE